MARVKRAVHSKKHRRAVLEQAQGYFGNKSRSYRAAHEQVMHSLQYAYRDRRARKGDFRQLWIQRINAGARVHGMSYSRLIAGLRVAGVEVDRKVLADLAVRDDAAFGALVEVARDALNGAGTVAAAALAANRPMRSRPPWPPPRRVRLRTSPPPPLRPTTKAGSPARSASAPAVLTLRRLLERRAALGGTPVRGRGSQAARRGAGVGGRDRGGVPRRGRRDRGPSRTWPQRCAAAGAQVLELQPGVLARASDTVTPQPIAGLVAMVDVGLDALEVETRVPLVVCVGTAGPRQPGHDARARRRRSRGGGLLRRVGGPLQPEDGAGLGRRCCSTCRWSPATTPRRCSTSWGAGACG